MGDPAVTCGWPGPSGNQHAGISDNLPDPICAGLFALFGISLGQFYCGRPAKGLCWGAVGAVLCLIIRTHLPAAPLGLFFLAACAIDAYSTAQECRCHPRRYGGISALFWAEVILAISLCMAAGITTIVQVLHSPAVFP
jgi:hypothetical protein